MAHYYSDDRATQIVISLLKSHGISKVIVSPGTTNIALVGSMQIDPFFKLYSSVDERSAAYMACGLAYESGEPVVITCTEATASRNYLPGLTEAHYRKLPVLAITGNHGSKRYGHLKPQVIDRSQQPVDTVMESVNIDTINSKEDEWQTIVDVNKAILALTRNGGGPSHINLCFSKNTYGTKELPSARVIRRVQSLSEMPTMPKGKIAIFVGSHKPFSQEETEAIERFCEVNNATVFCDKTSAYYGKYRVYYAPVSTQLEYDAPTNHPDLIIHIGEVSGETYTQGKLKSKSTWRVSEDGEIRDTFRNLKYVFQMREKDFFTYYKEGNTDSTSYYEECLSEVNKIVSKYPEVGFSNIWVAQTLANSLPKDSYLHLGIYNSLRSWNFAQLDASIKTMCNVGGFGIDGALSTILGASLANPDKLHFVSLGDLAFFYDLNALGNRELGNNLRILVVNNGKGVEFRKLDHPCAVFGEDADPYMAAAGHFGNKSVELVKSFATSLGFEYISASSKEEFHSNMSKFVNPTLSDGPIIFEVFTESEEESKAIDAFRHIASDVKSIIMNKAISIAKAIKR